MIRARKQKNLGDLPYVLLVLPTVFLTVPTEAYVGPGLGLGAIGAILALVLAGFLAVVGVVWYPIKRMFRGKQTDDDEPGDESASPGEPEKEP